MRHRSIAYIMIAVLAVLIPANAGALSKEAESKVVELAKTKVVLPEMPSFKSGHVAGMKYYFLKDTELPIVNIIIYIKGGWAYDPVDKRGLSTITTGILRTGGTKQRSPEEMDAYLDSIAANIGISSNGEWIVATVSCLSKYVDESLSTLLDMMFEPRFDAKRLDLLMKQHRAAIERRKDSAALLAETGFNYLLYGDKTAWGVYPTIETINNVTIDDIRAYQKKIAYQKNMIIGIAGDVSPGEVLGVIKKYKSFPIDPPEEFAKPEATPEPKKGIHIIDKPDATQVAFDIGHEGTYRNNPDKFAIRVMNDALGAAGAFNLNRRLPFLIRVENGLAYSVNSSYDFGPEWAPGAFDVTLGTKTETSKKALELSIQALKLFREEGITQEEFERSRESILNSLVFDYATAFGIISSIVHYNYFGFPDNYVEIYAKKIAAVTKDHVDNVAKKYLHPDQLQVVVAGNKVKLEEELKDYMTTSELIIKE